MKLGFVYNAPCNILDVLQNPHDDASAYICYLAMQLAKIGNDVTIFSQNPHNVGAYDVRGRHISIKDQALILDPALLEKDFAALIFVNESPEFAVTIKSILKYDPKIYLWTAYDSKNPINKNLANAEYIARLNGVICLSYWHRTNLLESFPVLKDKVFAIEHAISPFFENLFIDAEELAKAKTKEPQFVFFAGQDDNLNIVLDALPDLNRNFKAQINIYNAISEESIPNVKYFKGLSKIKMAEKLRHQTILANPSTYKTTSSVPLLEAIAAGVYPVTSDVGSYEEYCHEHGKILAPEMLFSDSLEGFVSELLTICQTQVDHRDDYIEYCYNACKDINEHHTWAVRARTWLTLLSGIPHKENDNE